jgi:superfamily II helicase
MGGLYEGIKDVAKVIQKADNVELYQKLIDLSSQALDMQDEITELRTENKELKKERETEEQIVRHTELYITLGSDNTKYCTHCWDASKKLIQVSLVQQSGNYTGKFICPKCTNEGIYDNVLYKEHCSTVSKAIRSSGVRYGTI